MDISKYLKNSKFIKEMRKYLTWNKWIIGFFIAVGLVLTCAGDRWGSPLITHFGMAFLIAGIVGFYLEITAVKMFVEDRLSEVLIKDEYLESLNEIKLTTLIFKAMKFLGKRILYPFLINDAYELDDFVDKIQGDVIDNLGATYRQDFNQIIVYSELDDGEIKALGANPDDLKGVVCIKTTTRFHLIAPTLKEESIFEYDFSYDIDLIKGLELKPEALFNLSIDETVIKIDFDKFLTKTEDGKSLSFKYKHDVKFLKDNSYTTLIKFEKVEYKIDKFDPLRRLKSNMNYLTHGARIHFSSRHDLELDAEFFGIYGGWDNEPNKTDNFISIDYDGWAFPQDGYFIYFAKKKI